MEKRKIITFLLLVFLCACTRDGRDVQPIVFDMSKGNVRIQSLDVIEKMQLVQLSSDSVKIGEVDKVLCRDTLLYVLDRYQQKCVYIFNTKGVYLNTISRMGHGSGEYVNLTDIFIDEEKQTLNLLSREDKKILVYDFLGMKLLKEYKLPKMFFNMVKIDGGYIGSVGNCPEDPHEPYNCWILDNDLRIKDKCVKIDPLLESSFSEEVVPFSVYKHRCDIISEMNYEVFSVEKLYPKLNYELDFGNQNFPQQKKADLYNPQKIFEIQDKYITNIYRFQETEKHILVYLVYQGMRQMFVYDKIDHTSQLATLDTNREDILIGFGNIVGLDSRHIYTVVDMDLLCRFYQGHDEHNNYEEMYPRQIEKLRKQIYPPKKDDNPVILIYTIN